MSHIVERCLECVRWAYERGRDEPCGYGDIEQELRDRMAAHQEYTEALVEAWRTAPKITKYQFGWGFDLFNFEKDYQRWMCDVRLALSKATGEAT